MVDLNKLDKPELAAAMRGGTEAWGQCADADKHVRYAALKKMPGRKRRCKCGCGGPETYVGCANGLALMGGCQLSVQRWVKGGRK